MTTRTRTALVTSVVLLALAGCSSGDGATGGDTSAGGAADAGLEAPQQAGGAGGEVAVAADGAADGQQVVVTARAILTADDPVAAARDVVALVERLDGRVDAQRVRAGGGDDDPGDAELTVRVPSSAMATISDDLGEIARVGEFSQSSEDVTGAAQDLDARITAAELSVERMQDLLGRAPSTTEVISAESALTERQASLERLRSERDRLADRVALSTLDVAIYPPDAAPVVAQVGPRSFLDGLATGWTSFVTAVRGLLVVVGVLLPWAVAGGAVVAAVVVVRRRRRTAAPEAPAAPAVAAGSPPPTYGGS